jgi:hypothetical protein
LNYNITSLGGLPMLVIDDNTNTKILIKK